MTIKRLFLLMVMLFFVLGWGITPPVVPPEIPPTTVEVVDEIQRVVEVEAEELILHYSRQSFWGKEKFSYYSAHRDEFEANFKKHFGERLTQKRVSVENYSFSFDRASSSITVRCDLHQAVSGSRARYTARFEWLDLPRGFDLLNFEKISGNRLQGKTKVDGIPVTVTLSFPTPTGNCHWHVWWRE